MPVFMDRDDIRDMTAEMGRGQKNPHTCHWARRGTRARALADLRTKSAY